MYLREGKRDSKLWDVRELAHPTPSQIVSTLGSPSLLLHHPAGGAVILPTDRSLINFSSQAHLLPVNAFLLITIFQNYFDLKNAGIFF